MKHVAFLACLLTAAATAAGQVDDPFGGLLAPQQGVPDPTQLVLAEAVPSHTHVSPGGQFHVALLLDIASGWVYYSPDPGEIVLDGRVDVRAGDLAVGATRWPMDKPKTTELYPGRDITNNAYTGRVVLYVPLEVPADAEPGPRTISLAPTGQVFEEVCVDLVGVSAAAQVQVAPEPVANPAWTDEMASGLAAAMTADELRAAHQQPAPGKRAAAPAETEGLTVWGGLALALLAGLTLNIMPCILPVIPLRILSIVGMAHESRRRFVTLGLAFAAGMLLFFVGIAIVSGALRLVSGEALNISDHFQYPAVRIALALVLVALAANLFGVFDVIVPSRLAAAEGPARCEGHLNSLGMGFMMAVLATPCSFAFLLAAMAWAQVQPLWLGTVAILLVGVGMAAPHALLSAFPDLVKRLPKPGHWMELFKHAMGFLLLPVAIWLLSTLAEDTWPFWVAAYGVVLCFALWVWGKWVRYDAPLSRKLLVRGAAVAIAVVGGIAMLPPPEPLAVAFRPVEQSLIESANADGRTALVKITAAWCLECQVIDARVYDTAEIAEALAERNVLALKADVTDRASAASQWVREHVGGAPPITMIYPPAGEPVRLVGAFDKGELLSVLDASGGAGE